MAITVRRNFPALTAANLLTQSDFEAVGRLLRQRIIARTESGIDARGQRFAPYHPSYALQKGRELLGSEASYTTVDLVVSGEMLRGIEIEATPKSVTLFFR